MSNTLDCIIKDLESANNRIKNKEIFDDRIVQDLKEISCDLLNSGNIREAMDILTVAIKIKIGV